MKIELIDHVRKKEWSKRVPRHTSVTVTTVNGHVYELTEYNNRLQVRCLNGCLTVHPICANVVMLKDGYQWIEPTKGT